ncbi:hypothetical protein XELAEV_18003149mg [Xenopus laevis]|nr:hypothetical protein XELAEV_18003149mg [Xenopus laevis]
MFILNFEVVMEKDVLGSPNKDTNHKVQSHWFPSGRGKSFKLKLPALLALAGSKQSLPQEDPDVVVVDLSKHSSDTVALEEVTHMNNCIGSQSEDQQALISSKEPPEEDKEPAVQSSPHTDKDHLNLDMSFSNCSLARSRSRESFYSIRRASSVDDIEAMKVDLDKFRNRNSSTGEHSLFAVKVPLVLVELSLFPVNSSLIGVKHSLFKKSSFFSPGVRTYSLW